VFDEVVPGAEVLGSALEVGAEMAALPTDVYARTKQDLRGPALATMREAVSSEPLLAAWVSPA
jgi:hypothetical protein